MNEWKNEEVLQLNKCQVDDEYSKFERKVEEVCSMVSSLSSGTNDEVLKAIHNADMFLAFAEDKEFSEDGLVVKTNKTCINKKTFKTSDNQNTICKEAFMDMMEKDANDRAENKRQRKEIADSFKTKANKAYREKDFEKALYLYDKAIEQVKDSLVLYLNRATTCLQLGLYSRVISDCEWALKLDDDNLRALLYKSKAYHILGDEDQSIKCIEQAKSTHTQDKVMIQDYVAEWQKRQ